MIAVDQLTKSYGARILFDRISFKINPKERVGLVGRNGHGKTTLLKILLGEEAYDSGALSIPKNYRLGYLAQHLEFTEKTVLEEGMRGLPAVEKDHHWKVEKILAGLGFSRSQMKARPETLSGGFQVRLNLAKTLVSEPDLLLLDEPTNYLDITSIRWVERYLSGWSRELVLITHDRSFMDSVVTHTMGIHRKKIKKIAGNTEKYYTQIAQEEEIYEKTRLKDERRRQEITQFITRFRAKARLAGLVQSRIKTMAKKQKAEKLEKIRDLEFRFSYRPFEGKQLLSVDDLSFAYPRHAPLFSDLRFTVHSTDRIGVVGPNGKGKTTLLKVLAGSLAPGAGSIGYHPDAAVGFYEQTHVHRLRDSFTVVQEIQSSLADGDYAAARNICGAMLFEGDDALKRIAVLSGGEKARVLLGKVIATPVNLLLLDEPTNHLDMESADALLAALDAFDGAVILVTHNEMYLHALANRLIVFQKDRVEIFQGGYQDFLEAGGWEDDAAEASAASEADPAPGQDPVEERKNKKALRKERSKIIKARSRHLNPLLHAIAGVEHRIETLERELENAQADLIRASKEKDGMRIAARSIEVNRYRQEIDYQFDALEKLYLEKEVLEKRYALQPESVEDP
ncbi:MAG: ABC-F family ATP-binding cassette domain-containing protein [Deltaproteobacteria bacterium]|nr:ABC-F family ATP-binding cassette domain-containing protein [Deltaproteobacteria bacterium]MBW2041510.1 ABC-F family ATP-binding cassette domain-containing protein [Deltaproteobacteria bacterium]MBW2131600.1 ABC-F family ATP-binding cassette domain-containing protein [Deltaproteobacteria bacterium]